MIKCTLIEVGNDDRAIICTGAPNVGDTDGEVSKTAKLVAIDYIDRTFFAGGKIYDFSD